MGREFRSRITIWLGQTLALAAVSFVTGRLTLMIAVWPGDATPIFPPAGIALAVLLLYGNRLAPGVFLGSLLISCTLGPFTAAAVGIAVGSTLQAMLAAWLVRRFVGFPTALTLEGKAIRFLLLGGPVACVFAATVGIGVLEFTGELDSTEQEFNWLNWWVGDSIGVIIFAPLVLTILGKPRESWRPRRLTLGLPLLLLATTASMFFLYASHHENANLELEFKRQIEVQAQAIQRSLNNYQHVLMSIRSLYASSREVKRGEFRSFVAVPFQLYPCIQTLEWVPRVSQEELECFRERTRQESAYETHEALSQALKNFDVKQRSSRQQLRPDELMQAAPRPLYFPVHFVEPFEGNEAALGFDLASESERRRALDRACDTGDAVVTGRIRLVQQAESGYGYLVVVPVFKNKTRIETKDARRRHLLGYALGVFHISSAIQAALTEMTNDGIHLRVNDLSAPADEQLLFDERTVAATHDAASEFDARRVVQFADRRWSLIFEATPEFVSTQRAWHAWAMPVCVLLFMGLAMTFLLVATGHAMEIQQLVDERTKQLRDVNAQLARSNRDLEQFAYVASHDLQEPLRAVSGFCGLLKRKYDQVLGEQGKQYADFAVEGANRMQRLLLGLLEYSRVNSHAVNRSPTDCNKLLDEALENLKVPLEASGAVVTHDSLPTVSADPSQMVRLLQNLLANAIKYCNNRHPKVHVKALADANGWTFSVRDDGIGIDPDYHKRIFVIFRRLHTRDEYEGTGIGLAVCERIIEQHNGRIWVESAAGEGSTFFFTIPGYGTTT